jgi:hypothetical protein
MVAMKEKKTDIKRLDEIRRDKRGREAREPEENRSRILKQPRGAPDIGVSSDQQPQKGKCNSAAKPRTTDLKYENGNHQTKTEKTARKGGWERGERGKKGQHRSPPSPFRGANLGPF